MKDKSKVKVDRVQVMMSAKQFAKLQAYKNTVDEMMSDAQIVRLMIDKYYEFIKFDYVADEDLIGITDIK